MTDTLSREKLEEMGFTVLPEDDYKEVMEADDDKADQLIVGVKIYYDSAVAFYSKGGTFIVMLQDKIGNPNVELEPDFNDARPVDHGNGVAFGDFEVATDWVWWASRDFIEEDIKL